MAAQSWRGRTSAGPGPSAAGGSRPRNPRVVAFCLHLHDHGEGASFLGALLTFPRSPAPARNCGVPRGSRVPGRPLPPSPPRTQVVRSFPGSRSGAPSQRSVHGERGERGAGRRRSPAARSTGWLETS